LEASKEALEMGFEHINHPLAHKHVKDFNCDCVEREAKVVEKKVEKGELQPHNCLKAHWEQLKEVL
jgi:hypothetical protein